MARRLKEIDVAEISLVDAAANRKKFLIVKKALGEGAGVGGERQGIGGAKYCVCPECGYAVEHKRLGEGKSKPCAQIECPECGEKMRGSNTKKVKKMSKQKLQVSIDSDGTVKGTKILVNGEEIKELRDFHFSFYQRENDGVEINPVSCSYSKDVEIEDGFKRSETFYLSKSNVEVKKEMNEELKKQLQDYLGDNAQVDFEKAEEPSEKVIEVIKGALKLVNEYKGDFPDDLAKAVGTLGKYASYGYGYPVQKSDDKKEEGKVKVEKAGAKLSKTTMEAIRKVIDSLSKLVEPVQKVEKDSGDDDDAKGELGEIKKGLETLIEKLEKKDEGDAKTELAELKKRLETVEKAKGIKKSLDGDGDEEGIEKGKKKWPSITG